MEHLGRTTVSHTAVIVTITQKLFVTIKVTFLFVNGKQQCIL